MFAGEHFCLAFKSSRSIFRSGFPSGVSSEQDFVFQAVKAEHVETEVPVSHRPLATTESMHHFLSLLECKRMG